MSCLGFLSIFNLNLRHIFLLTLTSSVFLYSSRFPSLLFSCIFSVLSLSSHVDLSHAYQLLFSPCLTFIQKKYAASRSCNLDQMSTYQLNVMYTDAQFDIPNICKVVFQCYITQHKQLLNSKKLMKCVCVCVCVLKHMRVR